jgi:tetratricopeptide (TPR) repeat protein
MDLLRHIMLYNNLAYHLHLLGDPSAANYAQAGIELARQKGSLSHLPYLYSTLGEIALSQGSFDQAERYFSEGLTLAEQVPIPERIAGLKANLGLVYRSRNQLEDARNYLLDALTRADQLGNQHLAVRIRIWIAPLFPSADAKRNLQEAYRIAESSGFSRLLEEIEQVERTLNELT